MQPWHWFAFINITIVVYYFFAWIRVNFVLGRVVLNVVPPPKRFALLISIPAVLIIAYYFNRFFREAGDLPHWYGDEGIMMPMLGAAVALMGVMATILDEQIREEGIYVRQRVYTWNNLRHFTIDDCVLKITTTKTKWDGRPRKFEWNLHKEGLVAEVAGILEDYGVKRLLQ